MKKLVVISFFVLFSITLNAQYRFGDEEIKHHQINLNGSASTWGMLFRIDANIKIKSDSFGYTGRAYPAIQLAYDYYFNEKASLGIIGSSQTLGMKVNYITFKNSEDIPVRYKNFNVDVKRRYIGLRFNYHFVNDDVHDLYGGARFGIVFWKVTPSVSNSDLDSKFGSSFPGTMFPSLAFGYKYKIKERIGIGAELSLGIPQLFAYGIDYRF